MSFNFDIAVELVEQNSDAVDAEFTEIEGQDKFLCFWYDKNDKTNQRWSYKTCQL